MLAYNVMSHGQLRAPHEHRERFKAHTTTWSKPAATNAKVGNQMPATLLEYSLPMNDRYAARQTSQFAPMPRRKI
jgi:hypothetical protein